MKSAGPSSPISFTAADLPIVAGRVYHLSIRPEDLANEVIVVGDPGRATHIGKNFLQNIEVDIEHRGLRSITGQTKSHGHRVSVITTGMGTSSVEVVLAELVVLKEIDFATLTRKPPEQRGNLTVIRLGTSGALQAETPLGTSIITEYAVGLDNTAMFYDIPVQDSVCSELEEETRRHIEQAMNPASRFRGKILPYVSRSSPEVVRALASAATALGVPAKTGITVSNSGFFAAQGRDVQRLPLSVPDIDQVMSELKIPSSKLRVENMEMEASFINHFLSGLGYRSGAVCICISNRRLNTFDSNYLQNMERATELTLEALWTLRAT